MLMGSSEARYKSQVTKANPLVGYGNLTLAFIFQNAAIGLTFGCFGLLIEPISGEFGGGRSIISLSIGSISLVFGLLGPLVGILLDRWSVRHAMLLGCALSSLGFYFSGQSSSALEFLLSFGLLVGAGFTFMGVLPASKLANLWFPKSGRATGFVNVPLLNALGPPLFSIVLVATGWRDLMQVFGLIMLGLFALCFLIRAPRTAVPNTRPGQAVDTPPADANATTSPLRDPVFWAVSIAKGLLMSSGIVAITHIVSYAIDNGIEPVQASVLLSMLGIASAMGALLYGWLCDRFPATRVLLVNAALQMACWVLILLNPSMYNLAVVVPALGLCTGGVSAICLTILGRHYPATRFGAAIGKMMFAMIPFTFVAAPIAGALYDWRGNYVAAFILETLLCGATIVLLLGCRRILRGL